MKRLFRFLILPLVVLTACVDSLDDYNVDQKQASSVLPETLYTSALKGLTDVIATPNVNVNNFRLYVQHWSTTQYLDEPRYILTVRLIPENFWTALYRNTLSNLKEAKQLVEADAVLSTDARNNRLAQIGIIEVYAWAALVNTFGNVPYTEALNTDIPLPKYDDAETIYIDLLDKLDAAIGLLNTNAQGFGAGELLYASKAEADRIPSWTKFANSLKLKLAMNLVDNASTQSRANTAITQAAPNVFGSNADNARFPYIQTPPNNNPVSENLNPARTSRQDYVGAQALVDMMNTLNDPRRPFYFATAVNFPTEYIGGFYGYTNNPTADYSQLSTKAMALDDPALFVDYSEVEFLLAEAKERGILAGGSVEAETHYNNAIRASILYWGGTDAAADTYLAQAAVAYTTATGTYKQKIGEQKWVALFNRGWDAWVEWKRLDYPELITPNNATPPPGQEAPAADLKIPVRLIYPINEQTLNGSNRSAASTAIGGDLATTKLFWDVF